MEYFIITMFNKKQLILTYDMIIEAKVRDILASNNIDYVINPVMLSWNATRAEYKIYVRKCDY